MFTAALFGNGFSFSLGTEQAVSFAAIRVSLSM